MHGNYPPTTTPNLPATQRHPARDAGTARLDLKHLGLIVSAGTAVGLRFFSDFDLRAVEQRAIGAGLDATPGSLAALVVQTLVAQLHHDWFNLSPVAPFQVGVLVGGLACLYVALRRMLAPEPAVLAALLAGLLSPLVVDIAVCLLAIGRVSHMG